MELFLFLRDIPYITEILTIVLSLHTFALAVVNLTPTPQDDGWVRTAYRYIEFVAGIVNATNVKQK